MRRIRHHLLALSLLTAGCATAPSVRLDQGQVQRQLADLEREVLRDSAKFQELIEHSGAIYEDAALEAYVNELVAPLVPALPADSPYHFRLKVLRDPTLNAYTLGDGAIYFNAGLIARLKSAEQFAFVMSHEIAHVMNRDLVYFTDSLHKKTVTTKLANLVVTPALSAIGLGGVGELGLGLAYVASVTGYGREREAAADRESLQTMRRLNQDEREALRVFETFMAERERYQRGIEISFLSSHPSNQRRMRSIREFMGPKALDVFAPERPDEAFLGRTQRLRVDNAAFNIQLGRYYHAVEDLQIILQRTPDDALAHYHLGEAYRLIAQDPRKLKDELNRKAWRRIREVAEREQQTYWRRRAAEEYEAARADGPELPEVSRGLGLLCRAQGDSQQALSHLRRYLELAPHAKDRRYITGLMSRIEEDAAR